jgi:hypothetical protein
MRVQRPRSLSRNFAAVAVLTGGLALVGCAQDDSSDPLVASEEVSPAAYGYVWRGPGEPGNFGAAYTICRRGLGEEDRERLVPYRTGSVQSARTDPMAARRLRSCLEGKGWIPAAR